MFRIKQKQSDQPATLLIPPAHPSLKRWRAGARQAGQTLIETIMAIFILSTALTAGLGMAIFALTSSEVSYREIIATNLAREGIEVARMMRDSNWLAGAKLGDPQICADIGNQPCYPNAFTAPYNFELDPAGTGTFEWRFRFTPGTRTWYKDFSPGSSRNYLLCLQPDGTYQHNDPGGSGITCASSLFARRILFTVRTGTSYGYSASDLDNAEVIVHSIVQWNGKSCPVVDNNTEPNATHARCKIVVEERLTNWKDYR